MWAFRRAELPVVPQEETDLLKPQHFWKIMLVWSQNQTWGFSFFPHKSWLAESNLGDISSWTGKLPDLQTNHFVVRTPKSGAVSSMGALSLPAHGISLSQGSPAGTDVFWRCLKSFALYLGRAGMRGGAGAVWFTFSTGSLAPHGNSDRDKEEPHQHEVLIVHWKAHPQIYCHFNLSLRQKRERHLQIYSAPCKIPSHWEEWPKRTEQNYGNRIETFSLQLWEVRVQVPPCWHPQDPCGSHLSAVPGWSQSGLGLWGVQEGMGLILQVFILYRAAYFYKERKNNHHF